MEDPTSAQILYWVQQGDYLAYNLLLDRYYGAVERYSICLLRDSRAAALAAGAAFEQGFREARRIRRKQAEYPAHLFVLCRRMAYRFGNRRILPSRTISGDWLFPRGARSETGELPLSIILNQDRDGIVRRAFDTLHANDREIIHLAFEPTLLRKDLATILTTSSDRILTARLADALQRLGEAVLRSGINPPVQSGKPNVQRSASI